MGWGWSLHIAQKLHEFRAKQACVVPRDMVVDASGDLLVSGDERGNVVTGLPLRPLPRFRIGITEGDLYVSHENQRRASAS